MRKNLVYIPTDRGEYLADIEVPGRSYDIITNDFAGDGSTTDYAIHGHKWQCLAQIMPDVLDQQQYEYYVFLDNDIEISEDSLERLFQLGQILKLDLYQAALTIDSICSHPLLKQRPASYVRPTQLVEIMSPIMSHAALDQLLPTFSLSESGWGLDFLWAKRLKYKNMAVVDAVTMRHTKSIESPSWKLANGKTARQELDEILESIGNV